jgi:hypothetical protein
MRGIAPSVWDTPIIEPSRTATMIHRYVIENVMLLLSTLMEAAELRGIPDDVLAKASTTEPMNRL